MPLAGPTRGEGNFAAETEWKRYWN